MWAIVVFDNDMNIQQDTLIIKLQNISNLKLKVLIEVNSWQHVYKTKFLSCVQFVAVIARLVSVQVQK